MIQNDPFEEVKSIVVIKLRHIGDVLLTVPVFRALREHFPQARIAALVNSGTEEVIVGNPLVDEIVLFDRTIKRRNPAQRYLCELSFLRQLRQHHFDMAVSLTSGDRSAVIAYFSGARYRIAYDPGAKGLFGKRYLYTHRAKLRKRGEHSVIKNLDVIAQFGITTDDLSVDFHIPEEARTSMMRILAEHGVSVADRVVHVHPTSRWLFKCWKDSFMAEVIRWFTDRGMKVIVTSSPDKGELERVRAILSLCDLKEELSRNHLVDLSGKITIKQLAAVSQRSVLFFGVDTAPMHIAAAVGTPVVALFGAGQQNWRPWGEGHCIITSEALPRQSISREEWVKRNLERITPQDVVAELERRFAATQGKS